MQNRIYEEISHIFTVADPPSAEDADGEGRHGRIPLNGLQTALRKLQPIFAKPDGAGARGARSSEYRNAGRAGEAGRLKSRSCSALRSVPEIMQIAERTGEPAGSRRRKLFRRVARPFRRRAGLLAAAGGADCHSRPLREPGAGAQSLDQIASARRDIVTAGTCPTTGRRRSCPFQASAWQR